MKKILRKKFILFAMSAVTILLAVLVGAINGFSWIILDRQSSSLLYALINREAPFPPGQSPNRQPPAPPMAADMLQSARFFTVHTDQDGRVLEVDVQQISSVSAEQAVQYAELATGVSGTVDHYKYAAKQTDAGRILFFLDTSGQLWVFMMVLSISSAIALVCWLATLLFVILLSGRAVRPILAGMEKQKQFITNAGHELKTPLAIIQANNDASTLLYGETKYSKNIQLQIQRLDALTMNLLTIAKLDEGARLPAENLDISDLVSGMLAAYEEPFAQRRIPLSADIQPHILMRAHRETFLQMVSILLNNAVKYTPEGGTVWFSMKNEGGHIEITEENTWEAPTQPNPEQLFERFYRGDSARTQQSASSGYGVGLSAARAIAEAFGGKLAATYPKADRIRFTARF